MMWLFSSGVSLILPYAWFGMVSQDFLDHIYLILNCKLLATQYHIDMHA